MRLAGVGAAAIGVLLAIVACGSSDEASNSSSGNVGSSSSSTSSGSTSSSGATSSSGGTGSLCAGYASALCTWVARCYVESLKSLYVDVDVCRARETLECERTSTLDGAAPMTAACVSELETLPCAATVDNIPLWVDSAACDLRGGRAAGARCERNRQCQSGMCNNSDGRSCGTCKDRVPLGGACTPYGYADCERDLRCLTPGPSPGGVATCQPLPKKGESCTTYRACEKPYRCATDVCVDPLPKDAPCDLFGVDPCNVSAGQECRDDKCQDVIYANLGETCNATPARLCRADLRCLESDGGYTCHPRIGDGQPCVGTYYNQCAWPMTCVNDTCAMAPPDEDCK